MESLVRDYPHRNPSRGCSTRYLLSLEVRNPSLGYAREELRTAQGDPAPPFDRAVSALADDLGARGLLDDVLVVVTGEFGRTPRIGQPIKGGAGAKPDGRDHWPGVFSLLAFGAGVARGRVLGASDRLAASPASPAFTPADLAATLLQSLGVDPSGEIRDPLGRPYPVNSGIPIPWA